MRRIGLIALILVAALVLGGCARRGGALLTWLGFGTRAAVKVEKAEARAGAAATTVDEKREAVLEQAHTEAHRTLNALGHVPASRGRDVALPAAQNTVDALDTALGPVSPEVLRELRDLNTRLMSEVEEVRVAAEAEAAGLRGQVERVAAELEQARTALRSAEARVEELRVKADAVARENARLANEARAWRLQAWIFRGLAGVLLLGAGYLWVQLRGVGTALPKIKSLAGGGAGAVIASLDGVTSAVGQWIVRSGRKAAERKASEARDTLSP